MGKSNDHFIQVAYTKNFSQKIESRKSNISIISSSLDISEKSVAEDFSKSNGMLLNCFDDIKKDPTKINIYGFYWNNKEDFLKDFLSKNLSSQKEIKEYFSLLWARNLFAYDDAKKQLNSFKENNHCNLPEYIISNLNLKNQIKDYPENSCQLRNEILMERFAYFSSAIKDYNVGYLKSETEIFLLGENPVFHISILNDNDYLELENMFKNKPDMNLFSNLIFVPLSWDEFYYLYKNDNEKKIKENLINQIIDNKIYNKYAIWMSSRQTLVNNKDKDRFEEFKLFYKSVRENMQNVLIKNKE